MKDNGTLIPPKVLRQEADFFFSPKSIINVGKWKKEKRGKFRFSNFSIFQKLNSFDLYWICWSFSESNEELIRNGNLWDELRIVCVCFVGISPKTLKHINFHKRLNLQLGPRFTSRKVVALTGHFLFKGGRIHVHFLPGCPPGQGSAHMVSR